MKTMKRNKCKSCNYYKRAYDEYRYRFWRRKDFYCTFNDKITLPENGCENRKKKKKEYDASLKRLAEVEKDILSLFEYLKDEEDFR